MGNIKETSTFQANRKSLVDDYIGVYAANLIAGQWTLTICCHLSDGKLRFGELRKRIPYITERVLTLQLRKMEKNGLITRKVYAEVPPKVEYELADIGRELVPIIRQLEQWGGRHKEILDK